jgi:DNA-binding HxlR family transcriptional regulator
MAVIDFNCDDITDEEDDLARDVIARIADKWALWVLHVLSESGTLRFSRVRERVEGISQKMLTKTLRELERDGFITRTIFPEVPPRVEYALTPLGVRLLQAITPMWKWIVSCAGEVTTARARFDRVNG